MLHYIQNFSDGTKDWIAAGTATSAGVITAADINIYLTMASLALALLIGVPRLIMNWGTLLRWLRGSHDNLPRD